MKKFALFGSTALRSAVLITLACTASAGYAEAPEEGADTAADLNMATRIADAEFNHGQVVEIVAHLTDGIGGRLTNSPAMREAERWTQEQFRRWGLKNVRADGFEFGRGWWIESATVRMMKPRPLVLRAIPIAWTPATNGPLSAPIIVAPMSEDRHFADWHGKLTGKIVLVTHPSEPKDAVDVPFKRLSDTEIAELDRYQQPDNDPKANERQVKRYGFPARLDTFLKAEGALAWARMSRRPNGLVHGEGYLFKVSQTPALPAAEIGAEDYRRLARLAKVGPVTLEIDSNVHFNDSDLNAYNILADIPGRDPKAGYVMTGAHLDSWVAGDGATDNAAGSAVVMEAARILSSLGVKPKRTIRFALWAGEEQGIYGSFAYIEKYLARRPPSKGLDVTASPEDDALYSYPITVLPGFNDMAGYFNVDNGSGKVRGLYAEGNLAAVPMLREWLSPYASMGADAVVAGPTPGTDHVGMARLGLPAFQFIQDPLDYEKVSHHSNADTFDHLRALDLRQASVILASVLLSAADSDKPLPRNVLPTQPNESKPFQYDKPDER